MADEDSNITTPTRRKLPPLRGVGEDLENTGEEPKKKIKKKKKKVPQNTEDGTVDNTETKPKPKRKKPKEPVEGDPDAAEPGEDGTTKLVKKKRKPKSAAGTTDGEEGTTETPRKKKTPRKSKDATASDGDATAEGDAEPKKKTKKKGKKATDGSKASLQDTRDRDFINSAFMADLDDLKDDIAPKDEESDGDGEEDDDVLAVGGHVRSQPAPTLFIEKKDGFASKNKTKLMARLEAENRERLDDEEPEVVRDSLHTSLMTQKVIRTFSLWCHGILAGYAFWNLTMVYILSYHSDLDFLNHYQPVGQPCQNLYYLLFIICTVSALDKYDLGHPTKRVIKRCFTLQTGAISAVIYFISMVVSLSINNIDDRIWLYNPNNNTLWNVTSEVETTLNTWRIMNTIRASGCILGWIIISFQPIYDRLSKNLATPENFLGERTELNRIHSLA